METHRMNVLVLGGLGYIGSRLVPYLKAAGHTVDIWDIGYYMLSPLLRFDYKNLTSAYLAKYDWVILLAGHSSVPLCEADPYGSFKNNIVNFHELLEKLPNHTHLVWASSGSVLNGVQRRQDEEATLLAPTCHYDMQKQTIERIAALSSKRTYGLRFGTLSGYSRNPRLELMINSMYCDALDRGQVRASNLTKSRAVLGLSDLSRAILRMVEHKGPPGIYNMASFTADIGDIAGKVVSLTGAELITLPPDDKCYDFKMVTTKFEETFDFKFQDTVESIVEDLKILPLSLRDKTIYNRSTRLIKYE
jgi:nucleoside-diphosphate-sugar epimerase